MNLIIVESPTKSKTISKFLGGDFSVRASVGHVRDLPKSNNKAIDIKGGFIPHYEISEDKKDILEELKNIAQKADEVYLATDPDREGEAIAWHVSEVLGLKNRRRIVYHEITKGAIKEALEHPRKLDLKLVKAQEARMVLDRLVGYDLSGLIWKKVCYGLSAGRVQSPALHILALREKEIRAFIPEAYFVITAECDTAKKESIVFTCVEQPKDAKRSEEIIALARKHPWEVADVVSTEAVRRPYAPFTTSTLQQAASSRLGMSPSRTMRAAQNLYEKGFITYMRTDSISLSE